MKWIAIISFFVAYLGLVLVPMWKRRRAAASREFPSRVAPPIGADALRLRLKDIARVQPEIRVDAVGELVEVSWNLDEAAQHARPQEQSDAPTYMLELQIEDQVAVKVRYAVGVVIWEPTKGDSGRLEPSIEWRWPLEAVSAPEPLPTPSGGAIVEKVSSVPSLPHLVRLVRHCVLEAGYAWQPVLDIVPGEGATSAVRRAGVGGIAP